MGLAILSLFAVALGAAITVAVYWVAGQHQARTAAQQSLLDARQRAYQEFVSRTHQVVGMTKRIRTNPTRRATPAEAQEAMSAHQVSAVAVQLLSSHARLPEMTDNMVAAARSDLEAALAGTSNSAFVTQDDFKRLIAAMREELGLAADRDNDTTWSPLS